MRWHLWWYCGGDHVPRELEISFPCNSNIYDAICRGSISLCWNIEKVQFSRELEIKFQCNSNIYDAICRGTISLCWNIEKAQFSRELEISFWCNSNIYDSAEVPYPYVEQELEICYLIQHQYLQICRGTILWRWNSEQAGMVLKCTENQFPMQKQYS